MIFQYDVLAREHFSRLNYPLFEKLALFLRRGGQLTIGNSPLYGKKGMCPFDKRTPIACIIALILKFFIIREEITRGKCHLSRESPLEVLSTIVRSRRTSRRRPNTSTFVKFTSFPTSDLKFNPASSSANGTTATINSITARNVERPGTRIANSNHFAQFPRALAAYIFNIHPLMLSEVRNNAVHCWMLTAKLWRLSRVCALMQVDK